MLIGSKIKQITYLVLFAIITVKNTSTQETTAEYFYDYEGKRHKKVVGSETTHYHYDSWNVVAETDSSGNTIAKYTYDQSGLPLTMTRGSNTYYYHKNAHGDITKVTDSNGSVVATYEYDPWGKLLSSTGSLDNPYRYASYRYDTESGLYYLQARYYSPQLSKWLMRDEFGGAVIDPETSNWYAYGKNNPINYADPTGYVYARFNGYRYKVYHTNGSLWKNFPAKTGVGPENKPGGRIPHGRWRSYASEIDWFISWWAGWGPGRVPLRPIAGTNTHGRKGFFIHGYTFSFSNTKGCIRLLNTHLIWLLLLIPKLSGQRIDTVVKY